MDRLAARVTELEFVGGRREESAGESSDAPAAAPARPTKSAAKAPGFDDLDDDIPF